MLLLPDIYDEDSPTDNSHIDIKVITTDVFIGTTRETIVTTVDINSVATIK